MAVSMLNESSVVGNGEQRDTHFETPLERDFRLIRLAMLIVKANNGYEASARPNRPQHVAFIATMKQYIRTPRSLGRRRIQIAFDEMLHAYRTDPTIGKARLRQLKKGVLWAVGALRSAHSIMEGKKTGASINVLFAMVDQMLVRPEHPLPPPFPLQ